MGEHRIEPGDMVFIDVKIPEAPIKVVFMISIKHDEYHDQFNVTFMNSRGNIKSLNLSRFSYEQYFTKII